MNLLPYSCFQEITFKMYTWLINQGCRISWAHEWERFDTSISNIQYCSLYSLVTTLNRITAQEKQSHRSCTHVDQQDCVQSCIGETLPVIGRLRTTRHLGCDFVCVNMERWRASRYQWLQHPSAVAAVRPASVIYCPLPLGEANHPSPPRNQALMYALMHHPCHRHSHRTQLKGL